MTLLGMRSALGMDGSPAPTPVTVVGQRGTAVSAASSTSITVPFTAATAGQLLVVTVGIDKLSGGGNAVTGWTKFIDIDGTSTSLLAYWKVAVGGENTVTVPWNTASTAGANGQVIAFINFDSSDPIGSIFQLTYDNTAKTTQVMDPSAAGPNGGMACAAFSLDTLTTAPWDISAPGWSSITAGAASGRSPVALLTYGTQLTANQDLGSQTFTWTDSDQVAAATFAINGLSIASGTPATSSGGITLGGTATATAQSTVTGSITLGGTSTTTAAATAAGSISLGGTSTARAAITAAGSVTLGGTATGAVGPVAATASGSISLASPQMPAAASSTVAGTLTLGGAATASAGTTGAGTVTLGGAATAQAPVGAVGGISLGGTATAQARATAAGSITLAGTAASGVLPSTAAGSITLAGTATAQASSTTAGSITLSSPQMPAAARSTSLGTITLGGSESASAVTTAAGTVTLGGTATGFGGYTALGSITLAGTATARGAASSPAGVITLSGAPTAQGRAVRTVTTEVATDPSFELQSRSMTPGAPRWSYDLTVARTGAKSVKAIGNASTTSLPVGTFSVSPGDTVRVSAWRLTDVAYDGTVNNGKLRMANQAGALLVATPWDNGQTWAERVATYTVPMDGSVTGISMTLVADHLNGNLWIDDLSFQVTPAPPISINLGGSVAAQVAASSVAGAIFLNGLANYSVQGWTGGAPLTGTVLSPRYSGIILSKKVSGTILSKKQTGTVISPKLRGTVISLKLTGAVISPKLTGAVRSPKLTGTIDYLEQDER